MSNEIILINKMENTVKLAVNSILAEDEYSNVCKCQRCKLDIIALTLNKLHPRYVVTTMGNAIINANISSDQWRADVTTAVCEAIEIVNNNPRHGVN